MSTRILLVEDDADSAEAIMLLLQTHGIDVEWAPTAGEAITRYEMDPGHPFDAILLDLMLPDMDGAALVARLRAIADLPPVLVHSAVSQRDLRLAAAQVRAAAVLQKPVEWSRMRSALQEVGAYPSVSSP